MLYAVYRSDGSIEQVTKTYHDKDYGRLLSDHGMPYAAVNSHSLVSDRHWFVHTRTEELIKRPRMRVEINKTCIKAGNSDAALFTGIPKAARCEVTAAGAVIHDGLMDASELELHIPVPCLYRVRFVLWPYQDFEATIEAVQ